VQSATGGVVAEASTVDVSEAKQNCSFSSGRIYVAPGVRALDDSHEKIDHFASIYKILLTKKCEIKNVLIYVTNSSGVL